MGETHHKSLCSVPISFMFMSRDRSHMTAIVIVRTCDVLALLRQESRTVNPGYAIECVT